MKRVPVDLNELRGPDSIERVASRWLEDDTTQKIREELAKATEENRQRFLRAKFLYHRTSRVDQVQKILADSRIRLREELKSYSKGGPDLKHASLTTDIRNTTGGAILIVFHAKSLETKNHLVPVSYALPQDRVPDDAQHVWSTPDFVDEWEVAAVGGLNFGAEDIAAVIMDKSYWYRYVLTPGDKAAWTKEQKKAEAVGIQIAMDESLINRFRN